MTLTRWTWTLAWWLAWVGAFVYALYSVHNAWGMVMMAGLGWASWCLLLNTVDLLFGRWLRPRAPQPPAVQPVLVERIILERVTPLGGR